MDVFVLLPLPIELGARENEHRLSVPERLMLVRIVALELREDVVVRVTQAVPSLTVQGTKFIFPRMPTSEEVSLIRSVAESYGCTLNETLRSHEDFQLQRRLDHAKRTGRYSP